MIEVFEFIAQYPLLAALVALVGLGAIFPDYRETNPARIVSGFGGTLTLILSIAIEVTHAAPFGQCSPAIVAARLRAGLLKLCRGARWLKPRTTLGTSLAFLPCSHSATVGGSWPRLRPWRQAGGLL